MLPYNTLSNNIFSSDIEFVNIHTSETTNSLDYKYDISGVLWRGRLISGDILLDSSINTNPITIQLNASEFSFDFDALNKPIIIYKEQGITKLYAYDILTNTNTVVVIDGDNTNPKIATDGEELIIAYIKNGNLYYRIQRERFLQERLLYTGLVDLLYIGMGKNNRFLFKANKLL